jgi:hypothetical protein
MLQARLSKQVTEVYKCSKSKVQLAPVLRHEGVWGSGCIDPCFLDLGTSWR